MIPELNLTTFPRTVIRFPFRLSRSAYNWATVLNSSAGAAVGVSFLAGGAFAGGDPFPMTLTDEVKMID